MCHPAIDGSISFDTGYLSSHINLGFNAEIKDRVSFRLAAQCAPLNDADHVSDWQDVPATAGMSEHQAVDALYGPSTDGERNSTYSFSDYRGNMECDQRGAVPPYILDSEIAAAGGSVEDGSSSFQPISELQVSNSDTSLVFLMFNNAYNEPVLDPWFSAQKSLNDTNAFCNQLNKTVYTRERPVTTLGCTQQWQICNSDRSSTLNASTCTPLLGINQINSLFADISQTNISFTPRQIATAQRIISSSVGASFYWVIHALSQSSGPPLKARDSITETIGLALPANQWQMETQYWLTLLLAYIQQSAVDLSTGQFAASTDYVNVTKAASTSTTVSANQAMTANAAHWLCQNQMIHSNSYRSFNFFALCFTMAICLVLIILGLCIEDLVGYVRQRSLQYTGHNGKQDMWIINSDLEMLRNLSKIQSGVTWGRSKSGIPLAQPGHKASINTLRSDDLEAERGTGIVNMTVRKTRTNISELHKMRSISTAHGLGQHKRCGTCSTFDLSPSHTTISGEHTPLPTPGATKANQQFMFQNNFQQSFNPGSFSGDPSPPTTARPDLPNTTTTIVEKMSKAFPYPPIPHSKPSNPIPNLTTNKPFVYTHSIPSHEDLQDPSTSMLTTDYNHDQREDIVHPPSGWGVLPRDRDSERSGHRPWRRRVDEYVQ